MKQSQMFDDIIIDKDEKIFEEAEKDLNTILKWISKAPRDNETFTAARELIREHFDTLVEKGDIDRWYIKQVNGNGAIVWVIIGQNSKKIIGRWS